MRLLKSQIFCVRSDFMYLVKYTMYRCLNILLLDSASGFWPFDCTGH